MHPVCKAGILIVKNNANLAGLAVHDQEYPDQKINLSLSAGPEPDGFAHSERE